MDTRKIVIWSGVGLLGVGIIVGVVLFLRAQNAPTPDLGQLSGGNVTQSSVPVGSKPSPTTTQKAKVRPYIPIDQTPKVQPASPNDPILPPDPVVMDQNGKNTLRQ